MTETTLELLIPNYPGLNEWNVLHVFRGSVAHGMYLPASDPNSVDDIDTMALCVPPLDHYFANKTFGSRGTQEIKQGKWDIVVYEFRKAISLLEGGNPNVLSLLWTQKSMYLNLTPVGQRLLDNRSLFTGKHVYNSFVGYAYGQLKKMTAYTFEGYMGEKRKALVDKYGFDTKNAAHCIRLLRMCVEYLGSGELQVYRPDARELLEIKRGEWSFRQVKNETNRLFALAEQAFHDSKLPEGPNKEDINILCANLVAEAFVWS